MATIKAQRAAKIKLEHPEKSMAQVMKEAGYADSTSDDPKLLTNSKGWKELMEEYLPDAYLAEKHKEFLGSKRVIRKYGAVLSEETDPSAVRALDMAYKLKNRYSDVNIGQALVVNISSAAAKKYGIDPSAGKYIDRQSSV